MIKIAIVDDEEQTREQILQTLKENIQEQHEVEIKLYVSGESFFEEIQKGHAADILFTDIQMQQLDGVELGKLVRRLCPDMYIVFITSYEEYAAESYRIEAYQYILKQDLEFRLPGIAEQLIEKLQKQKKEFCIIKDGTEQVKLLYKWIFFICINSKGAKYVNYVTTQGVVRERTSLENALKMLNSRQFLLVERGYAVNIKQICRVSGDTIYLEKGYEVPVSKARLAEVKREINLYGGIRNDEYTWNMYWTEFLETFLFYYLLFGTVIDRKTLKTKDKWILYFVLIVTSTIISVWVKRSVFSAYGYLLTILILVLGSFLPIESN